MSKNEFKAGDRVRLKGNGAIVTVVIAKDGWIAYDENRRIGGACPMEEAEPIDSKTAFLSELKGLLEKYGAEIELLSYDLDTTQLGITSNDFEVEYPIDVQQITAKNIMDYDKE